MAATPISVPITPSTQTIITTTASIAIFNVQVTLGVNGVQGGASCQINTYDPSGNFLTSQPVTLTQDQYVAWAQDDNYFISCVLANLGFTPTSPLVPGVQSQYAAASIATSSPSASQ